MGDKIKRRRNRQILIDMIRYTGSEVGHKYGISRERAAQIAREEIWRNHPELTVNGHPRHILWMRENRAVALSTIGATVRPTFTERVWSCLYAVSSRFRVRRRG